VAENLGGMLLEVEDGERAQESFHLPPFRLAVIGALHADRELSDVEPAREKGLPRGHKFGDLATRTVSAAPAASSGEIEENRGVQACHGSAGGARLPRSDLQRFLSLAVMQAKVLRSAVDSGLEVPPEVIQRAIRSFEDHYRTKSGRTAKDDERRAMLEPGQFTYDGAKRTLAMAAAGIVRLQEFGRYDDWRIPKNLDVIEAIVEDQLDELLRLWDERSVSGPGARAAGREGGRGADGRRMSRRTGSHRERTSALRGVRLFTRTRPSPALLYDTRSQRGSPSIHAASSSGKSGFGGG